jgi:phage terminase small subunit
MPGETSRNNGKQGGRPRGKSAKTLARERGIARALRQADITAERTVLELARVAFVNRCGIWRDGRIKPLHEWTDDERALLEGCEVVVKNAEGGDGHTDRVLKLHLARKVPALELLGKHFGLFVEKHQHHVSAEVDLVARLHAARARLNAARPPAGSNDKT